MANKHTITFYNNDVARAHYDPLVIHCRKIKVVIRTTKEALIIVK